MIPVGSPFADGVLLFMVYSIFAVTSYLLPPEAVLKIGSAISRNDYDGGVFRRSGKKA
jgi:hypothetical protein